MALCPCPDPSGLTPLSQADCAQGGGQISKLAFQLKGADFFTDQADGGVPATDIQSITAWQAQLTSGDVVVTPSFTTGLLTAGDFITRSGGNDTLEGATVIDGFNAAELTGNFENMAQADYDALFPYICKDKIAAVYLLTGNSIRCLKKNASNFYNGLPFNTFGVKGLTATGFGAADYNDFLLSMAGDWQTDAEYIDITTFKPTELTNP